MKTTLHLLLMLCLGIGLTTPSSRADKSPAADCVQNLLLSIDVDDMLDSGEAFMLQVANKFYQEGKLPRTGQAQSRLMQIEGSRKRDQLAEVLKKYNLTLDEWKVLEGAELPTQLVLGTRSFLEKLKTVRPNGRKLSKEKAAVLEKLNAAVDEAREKLKAALMIAEQVSLTNAHRFLDEKEVNATLQSLSRDPKYTLAQLGYSSLGEWRERIVIKSTKIRTKAQKALMEALKHYADFSGFIPETDQEILAAISWGLSTRASDIQVFFGKDKLFSSVGAFVDLTKEKNKAVFSRVIDQRYFSAERKRKMLEAIRNASEIVFFKLAENQDLKNFAAVERLAEKHNAPIIVAPAFSEVGLIPDKLKWLFEHPNVHIMVDAGIQLTKEFYVVDPGTEDKRDNPFVGLEKIYQPTDRVLVFHPRVRALTRPTGNFDYHPGYFMTTGSMSDPAYWSKFNTGMVTDFRAQQEAERNRGVVMLSRRYQNDNLSPLTGSAHGMVPRRVSYAKASYGNPEGLFDLGVLYTEDGAKTLDTIPAIVLGDVHLGITDPQFLKGTFQLFKEMRILEKNPKFGQMGEYEYTQGSINLRTLVLHDLIDGTPNNRHTVENLLTRAMQDKEGALDLENHVRFAASWVKQLTTMLPNLSVVVPVDNHGSDWLIKKLQEGDLTRGHRPRELPLLLRLMYEAIEDRANPYERIFQYFGIDTDRVRFLSNTETHRIGIDLENPNTSSLVQGVEVGQHSHQGVNGARSISLQRLLTSYGANVTGHTHSTAEFAQAKKVGTGTGKQDYQKGPSSADASLAIVYNEQAIQILRMERGSFSPNAAPQDAIEFFPNESFPRIIERKHPPGGPTTDQFRGDPPVVRYRR